MFGVIHRFLVDFFFLSILLDSKTFSLYFRFCVTYVLIDHLLFLVLSVWSKLLIFRIQFVAEHTFPPVKIIFAFFALQACNVNFQVQVNLNKCLNFIKPSLERVSAGNGTYFVVLHVCIFAVIITSNLTWKSVPFYWFVAEQLLFVGFLYKIWSLL